MQTKTVNALALSTSSVYFTANKYFIRYAFKYIISVLILKEA